MLEGILTVLFLAVIAVIAVRIVAALRRRRSQMISVLIRKHFLPTPLAEISISERQFPFRVRADLQRAIDRLFQSGVTINRFSGVQDNHFHNGVSLTDCIVPSNPITDTLGVPPQYEEVNIGDELPVRCLKNGLWLLKEGSNKFVVLLAPVERYGTEFAMRFQIATVNDEKGVQVAQTLFRHLEESVLRAESYRGKILSLEPSEQWYRGVSSGITVHKLRTVERDQVILPKKTLDLLDRNVIHFTRQRPQLARFRQATKKGILFYGPPGTGKTHTIHYLAKALEGHTTLLISAEQVGILAEYMTLARLLQPSIVVMEDVDLIARDRSTMGSACEETLLNKLLNEMDGLKEEADILFILTTNRPEALERALSSRPGRIDQAIEFPLPDDEGRRKLVRLYSQGVEVSEEVVEAIVGRTEKVSAAFIKELMRRSVQFHLERNGSGRVELPDVEQALEEMLFSGGSLNLKLLGAEQRG
jgi:cell division protease FtsH